MVFNFVVFSTPTWRYLKPEKLKAKMEAGPGPGDIIIGYSNTETEAWSSVEKYHKDNPIDIYGRDAVVSNLNNVRTKVAVLTNPKATH
jgi:hypothetical protein